MLWTRVNKELEQSCTRCGLKKELSFFSLNSAGRFGRRSWCKDCVNAYSKERFLKDPEKKRAQGRACYHRHKIEYRKAARESVPKYRERKQRYQRSVPLEHKREIRKRYELKNPYILQAKRMIGNAVRDKRLTKAEHCCINNERCSGQLEGHHLDYNKPLDVMWLCVAHHNAWHRIFIPEYKENFRDALDE